MKGIERECSPEAVMKNEVWSIWNGIRLKEDHTHYGKDVGHSKQQDGDEDH